MTRTPLPAFSSSNDAMLPDRAHYWWKSITHFYWSTLRRKQSLLAQSKVFDLQFRFRVQDHVGRRIYKRGIYEPAVTRYVMEHIRFSDTDVIVDIGANIGWYSLLFEQLASDDAHIFAFEPDPVNYGLLKENIRLNGATRIKAVNRALSDHEGVQTLYLATERNRGEHSLLALHEGEQVDVATATLDQFLERRSIAPERVRFIKIDVEGYEYRVLRGAMETLAHGPTLLSEYCPSWIRRGGEDPSDYLDLLSGLGYSPHVFGPSGPQPTAVDPLRNLEATVDLLWLRR